MLKVLDNVFYQRMTREAILPPADIKNIFTNLEEIVQLHGKKSDLSLMLMYPVTTSRLIPALPVIVFSVYNGANDGHSEEERDGGRRPHRRRFAVLGEENAHFTFQTKVCLKCS